MFGLFKKRTSGSSGEPDTRLTVDLHSHLLPGIDDGVQTAEDSLEIIRLLQQSGIRHIITTPHIMWDYYRNTPAIIREKLEEMRGVLRREQIDIRLDAAAEYYIDDHFVNRIMHEPMLTFGDNYLLVETAYTAKPFGFEQTLFDLKMQGYQPVLAHPERYQFLFEDLKQLDAMFETGVLFQMNLLSLTGYYSPQTQKAAEYMLKNGMVHFVGSDLHKLRQAKALHEFKKTAAYRKLLDLPLRNNSLSHA